MIKAVTVFAGARDQYQLPIALLEAGLLARFVTDFYYPADSKWLGPLAQLAAGEKFAKRYRAELNSKMVSISWRACVINLVRRYVSANTSNELTDNLLGKYACKVALRNNAAVFAYSYYAHGAFSSGPELPYYRFLFQLHPHPRSVRKLLLEEMELAPWAKHSLRNEVELSLNSQAFENLASEPLLANGWVTASTYTAKTLIDNGIPAGRIRVAPYGVDCEKFPFRLMDSKYSQRFTVMFLGRIGQRKGVSYLLEAVRLLKARNIRVVLCGHGTVDTQLLEQFKDVKFEIYRNISHDKLIRLMHESDIFVLPSLVEGFAHVILEAMSTGLPVISTNHTAALDIILDGEHGFIVPIRSPSIIAEKLAWGIDNRDELRVMGHKAAEHARKFTWAEFRKNIVSVYKQMLNDTATIEGSR